MASHPIVLTIAGSDSSGGAGIQADIKTLSALGAYSASVITSVTAQNTLGVQAVHPLPTAIIDAQLRAVFDDLAISCVKIGMLNTASTIHLVAQILREYRPKYVVLDPVMISTSGKSLIEAEAIHALVSELFPVSTLITPNIPEAAAILGSPPAQSKVEMHAALKELSQLGSSFTLLKGGHLPGKLCIDLLAENKKVHEFTQTKIQTTHTHGTGCTLASAISAYLAFDCKIIEAVAKANNYLNGAIQHADDLNIGNGSGPVHHFHNHW